MMGNEGKTTVIGIVGTIGGFTLADVHALAGTASLVATAAYMMIRCVLLVRDARTNKGRGVNAADYRK